VSKTILMPFKPVDHSHDRCVDDALRQATRNCEARGVRLTPLRRRVLELIWHSHTPVKAYDILDQLRDEKIGSAPPTVYRSLEFLLEEGLIHRIESLNAFVGCGEPRQQHSSQFLICEQCGEVAELDDPAIHQLLQERADVLGFKVRHETIEITGLCHDCSRLSAGHEV